MSPQKQEQEKFLVFWNQWNLEKLEMTEWKIKVLQAFVIEYTW